MNHPTTPPSVALDHLGRQITKWPVEVLSGIQLVLVYEEHILLEASVQVGFESKLTNDGVVVAVDMGVDTVHALEDLSNQRLEPLRERNTLKTRRLAMSSSETAPPHGGFLTDSAREDALVVNSALHPGHQVVDVVRRRHFRGLLIVLAVLPQVLELVCRLHREARFGRAELGYSAVEEIDLVVEVDHCERLV